ncbi:MAG: hypothetical protein FD147_1079 [Chloroflexi bacterium]|nr:MAG: hypothetical protein FD147_1079 [Chloroflexota bacterium]
MNKLQSIKQDALIALGTGVILGAILAVVSPGNFLLGWLGAGIVSVLSVLGLLRAWRFIEGGKALAVLMTVAFLARIVLGIFLFLALPVLGFNNPVQNSGYVFSDAYERDQAAFQMASSSESWIGFLQQSRSSDQYGGLLMLSAVMYQVFSPDIHRPLVVVMFSAFIMTMGLPFLFGAVKKRWGIETAFFAGWVYALYPDGLLLGSSQMREPFLIGLACIAFWASLFWKEKPVYAGLVSFSTLAIASLFSIPAGLAVLAVLAGVVFLDWMSQQKDRRAKIVGLTGFIIFIGIVSFAGWMWLKNTIYYDAYLTEASSGWITALLDQIGEKYRIPFITLYGFTQPVLPAALVDPSLPIWMGIAIFRALGWYIVLPFILYGFFALLNPGKLEHKNLLLWFSFVFAAWLLVSSLRAGGDQWDNPRYRTLFLPWMAIVVGWVLQRIQDKKSPWFWRWVAVEVVFVLFFLNWYINRHVLIGTQIPFFLMIELILIISGIIFIGGFVWDKKKITEKNCCQ